MSIQLLFTVIIIKKTMIIIKTKEYRSLLFLMLHDEEKSRKHKVNIQNNMTAIEDSTYRNMTQREREESEKE